MIGDSMFLVAMDEGEAHAYASSGILHTATQNIQ
jgi:hypothetical protein